VLSKLCNEQKKIRISNIAAGDQMFFGVQDFDFAQIFTNLNTFAQIFPKLA